ncbi:MAG: YdcF family protein [Ruminococcaceae bacterium]|nr:YdcF family protein [Oscillospiraceae bacterium]
MKAFFRFLLATIGLLILMNAGYLWMVSNYNLGLLLATILGCVFLLYALLFNVINRLLRNTFGRIIKVSILITATIFIFISTLISVAGRSNTVTYQEDAIIVLGAGIHEEQVSRVLAYRLDTALQYHKMNPHALLVLSGGQGPGETISEAAAMERYLLARGADPAKIIREERATSTYENFLNSKELLDATLKTPYKIAYITNQFHMYRAGRIAVTAGLFPTRFHAQNDLITLLPDYLRECCAILNFWIRG